MKDTTAEIDKTIDANQNIGSITVDKVKKAHSAYVETDRKSFYQILLELNGSSSAEAAATAKQLAETQEKLAGLKQTLESTQARRQLLAEQLEEHQEAGSRC